MSYLACKSVATMELSSKKTPNCDYALKHIIHGRDSILGEKKPQM